MRAVVQRVTSASVAVGEETVGTIGKGMMVLIGVSTEDGAADLKYIAEKVMHLRIYDDENGVRHGANPEREFVGDPRSEYSYGVFNAPIAQVAEQFMPGVETKEGASIDEITSSVRM